MRSDMDIVRVANVLGVDGLEREIECVSRRKIGQGSFGEVYHIVLRDGESYAWKVVFEKKEYMNRELMILKRVNHPGIVQLKWYSYGERSNRGVVLNVIMEYLPEDLLGLIKRRWVLAWGEFKSYALQMLGGVAYLHSLRIAHRDIKPSNVLIDLGRGILKVCDLGSAKEIRMGESNISYICSRNYRAPELHAGLSYDEKIDVWSTGCVLAELLIHELLFKGPSKELLLAQIQDRSRRMEEYIVERSGRPEVLGFARIIKKMLAIDPSERLSAVEAIGLFEQLNPPQVQPVPDASTSSPTSSLAQAKANPIG
ncbi:glycogen synthase kinase 3 beta [Nematocida homosporus]|uniref:glycogen synthase kinase 3 beta n=1 Tax=Nematocida homosporus TaxID=1912981 RepID=UPI00221EE651|nr:glycogen synthase kinase 3 beta [Nematocida homosporus]KAI5186847.1 glycogen synthase kinase 3 beta [Nematocida homosporus]